MPQPPFRMMVVARSQMGKTTLLIKLLQYFWIKQFEKIFIFCPTYGKDKKWNLLNEYVSSGQIQVFSTVKNNTIINIWKKCDSIRNKRPGAKFLIYFDDCTGQKDFKVNQESGMINQLVCKGNHSGISTIWVVQKFTQSSTIMRTNAEALITFYVQSDDEMKYIWKEFGTGSFKKFKDQVQNLTKDQYHNFFVNRQGPGSPDYYHNFKLVILN